MFVLAFCGLHREVRFAVEGNMRLSSGSLTLDGSNYDELPARGV